MYQESGKFKKSSVMGISKSRKSYKVYIFHSLHVYKKKERERKVENKVKIDKGSPHKRTESPWISSKPALFSVLY